jgi:HSP20 family protein
METKNLVPWNWFKNYDIPVPTILKDKNSLWDHSSRNIDRIFEDFVKDFGSFENLLPTFFKNGLSADLKILPRVDISDTDREYVVEADLPGVKEGDLDISVSKDGLLTIKGKRESFDEQKKRNYYRMERSYGSFERIIALPDNCDSNKVDASFQNGILSIKIPKKEISVGAVKHIKIAHKKD